MVAGPAFFREGSMHTRLRALAVMVAGLAASAAAQNPGTPATAPRLEAKTPGECTKGANDWRNEQMRAASVAMSAAQTAATTADERRAVSDRFMATYTSLSRESQGAARACAAGFSVEGTPSIQLVDLANLYTYVGDTASARRAGERAMAATDLPPRQRYGRFRLRR